MGVLNLTAGIHIDSVVLNSLQVTTEHQVPIDFGDIKMNGEGSRYEGQSMLAPFISGYEQTEVEPLIIDKGEGVYVWDHKGKKYLDALAGLRCTSLGTWMHFTEATKVKLPSSM